MPDFKNKYQVSDIYVVASGKSLDFIDNSFFDNEITIGLNQIYKIKTTYLLRKENILLEQSLKDNQDTIHFVSKGNWSCKNDINLCTVQKLDFGKVCIVEHDKNNYKLVDLPDENKLVVSWSTITSAIHLATYMGTKNIILVGHDCGSINGQNNVQGYYDDKSLDVDPSKYKSWLDKIEGDTIRLKQLLSDKYKCNICSINPFVNFNLEGNTYSRAPN